MKLLVVASVLVLAVYCSRSISSHDERNPILVFYVNTYMEDEYRELREQYRRINREEEERQRSTTQSGKIYKLDHKKRVVPPELLHLSYLVKHCYHSACSFMCHLLNYRIGVCVNLKKCQCSTLLSNKPWRI